MRVKGWTSTPFVEIHRPVLGVDHHHRVDHRAGGDVHVLPAAADGVGLLDLALDAAAAGRGEIRRQLRRIGQHQVPGVVPRGRQFAGRGQSRLGRVEQGVDRVGLQLAQVALGDAGVEDLAVGVDGHLAGAGRGDGELGRLHPAVDQQQVVALERGRVVDRPVGLRPVHLGHVRRHEARHVARRRAWRPASRPARSCRSAARRSAGSGPAGRS